MPEGRIRARRPSRLFDGRAQTGESIAQICVTDVTEIGGDPRGGFGIQTRWWRAALAAQRGLPQA